MKITPENPTEVEWVRAKAKQAGVVNERDSTVVAACQEWVREHPDVYNLKAGSVVSVDTCTYIVQSNGAWLRLASQGYQQRLIDPRPINWSGAEVLWSAPDGG